MGCVVVKDLHVLDLTREETCRALDLGRGTMASVDLAGEDYVVCQAIAERARAAGFEGIIAPSAALKGEFTLVVFPAGIRKLTVEHSRVQRPPKTMKKHLRSIPWRRL